VRLTHGSEHRIAVVETVGIPKFGYLRNLVPAFTSICLYSFVLIPHPSRKLTVNTAQRPYVDVLAHSELVVDGSLVGSIAFRRTCSTFISQSSDEWH
jgi:hypothetical protein